MGTKSGVTNTETPAIDLQAAAATTPLNSYQPVDGNTKVDDTATKPTKFVNAIIEGMKCGMIDRNNIGCNIARNKQLTHGVPVVEKNDGVIKIAP